MMTAENKISPRQLRRMLFIEMFGAGALSVPALACYNGQSGGVAVLFYGILLIIATVVFYILSEKVNHIPMGNSSRKLVFNQGEFFAMFCGFNPYKTVISAVAFLYEKIPDIKRYSG